MLWLFLTLFIGWRLVCVGLLWGSVVLRVVGGFGWICEVAFGVGLMVLIVCYINSVDCSFIFICGCYLYTCCYSIADLFVYLCWF